MRSGKRGVFLADLGAFAPDGLDDPVVDGLEPCPLRVLLPRGEEEDEPLQLPVRQSLPDRELLDSLIADVLEKFPQCGVHLQEGELVNDEVVSDDADVERARGGYHLPAAVW